MSALSVRCPFCGEEVGQPCTRLDGRPMAQRVHPQRVAAAAAEAKRHEDAVAFRRQMRALTDEEFALLMEADAHRVFMWATESSAGLTGKLAAVVVRLARKLAVVEAAPAGSAGTKAGG